MPWQALTIGIYTMDMEHGTISTTHIMTLGIITTAGITVGHGVLGIAGTEAFGDGTALTHGVIGDGDPDGITHQCMEAFGTGAYTTTFLANGTLLVDTWQQAIAYVPTHQDAPRWHHAPTLLAAVALMLQEVAQTLSAVEAGT